VAAAGNLRAADETDLFSGALDRYSWEYRGIKECFIPYNNYRIAQEDVTYDQILMPHHTNPDLQRWGASGARGRRQPGRKGSGTSSRSGSSISTRTAGKL